MLLQRSRDSHEVLVVDVRSTRRYHRSHIPDTHHIPSGKLVSGELPDFDLVLVADDEESAQKLAESLYDAGFRRRIMYLQGGFQSWRQSGRTLFQYESSANTQLALRKLVQIVVVIALPALVLALQHASTLLISLTLVFILVPMLLILIIQRPAPQMPRHSA
jgi:rhodanese-related sulfurtransferase